MRILMVSDQALFRDALIAQIQKIYADMLVTHVVDVADASSMLCHDDVSFDVVLVDEAVSDLLDYRGLDDLCEIYTNQKFIVLCDVGHCAGWAEVPVYACFLKSCALGDLVQKIRQVCDGVFWPQNLVLKDISMDVLTKRERQVLDRLAVGASNDDIARGLQLKIPTVKLHVQNVCRKLQVKNRTQAALLIQGQRLAEAI